MFDRRQMAQNTVEMAQKMLWSLTNTQSDQDRLSFVRASISIGVCSRATALEAAAVIPGSDLEESAYHRAEFGATSAAVAGLPAGPCGREQCAPVLLKVRRRLITANLRSPTSSVDEGR